MNGDDSMTTLVIDDDEAFARAVAKRLERRGHAARFVTSIEDARTAICSAEPDAIVLDLRLTESSGLDYLPELRRRLPEARIVVLSGFASISATVAAVQRGATDVMAKPADIRMLDAALQGRSSTHREPAAQPFTPARAEWEYIQRALFEHDGNVSATARALDMHRRTLQRKLRKHAPR